MRDKFDLSSFEQPRQYWAFCTNPDSYRIEDAVRELDQDSWTIPLSKVRAGHRALIWKAKGRQQRHDAHSGIVAFAEVLTDPDTFVDPNAAYWDESDPRSRESVRRVSLRYIRSQALPLWLDGPHHDLLDTLNVSRARGGTVFHVEVQQWEALMDITGGWPQADPAIAAVRSALNAVAGKAQVGQGFLDDAAKRQAIEVHAMAVVKEHYEQVGWHVEDVSKREPYDLLCRRDQGELRVEVKGTTGDGSQVLLTRNEVGHARQYQGMIALCVVANVLVSVDPQGVLHASGGTLRMLHPWDVDAGVLTPLAFAYALPPRS